MRGIARFLLGLLLLPVLMVTVVLALVLMIPGVEKGIDFVIDGEKEARW